MKLKCGYCGKPVASVHASVCAWCHHDKPLEGGSGIIAASNIVAALTSLAFIALLGWLLFSCLGCSSAAVPAASVAEPLNTCALDLSSPIHLHVETPDNPPCPGGSFACELPAWCKGFGEMATTNHAELFSVVPQGTISVVVTVDDGQNGERATSINGLSQNSCIPSAGAHSYRYENAGTWNVKFLIPCVDGREFEGALSGPL